MKKAINLLIIDKKAKTILAIKRKKGDNHYPGMWALPGGQVEKGETLRKAAVRELKEETGLTLASFGTKTLLKGELTINKKKGSLLVHEVSVKKGKISPTDPQIDKAEWIESDDLISSLIMNQYPRAQIQKLSQLLVDRIK